ncbi:cell envelope integrity protein CreD [Hufsiella ginkgonis]|uniref:Cell envelope integrity protein CreD n=1 Tax=Hufsiella ginkgonis TaxID=2695274 RepID=A0A7K1Y380_9SPHI|nr:cell envelope integrity protein CreD [Hufsiella ginkgonis]MXV17136.1 cell envelope integrity protein CreD [Hufsiella ginkgonis]
MNETPTQSPVSRLHESVLLKLFLVVVLALLLLIPSNAIQSLIRERQERQATVINEISGSWAGAQLVGGPVLAVPYRYVEKEETKTADSLKMTQKEGMLYVMPEKLNVTGKLSAEKRERGIFESVVYRSGINVSGNFDPGDVRHPDINPADLKWDKARVIIGLADIKGLKNYPVIRFGAGKHVAEPDYETQLFQKSLSVLPGLTDSPTGKVDFEFDLQLNGSQNLSFLHLGKTTTVKLEGDWGTPKFEGRYLPDKQHTTANSFQGEWKLIGYNRICPQQWKGNRYRFALPAPALPDTDMKTESDDAVFGVSLLLPVDQYQKTMRTSKYAILIILLTFLSLFFTELIRKHRIHLLHYILVGAAMTIYYVLLLSFAEKTGFNWAYLIASSATIILVSSFVASLIRKRDISFLYTGILSTFYGFIYVIIQLEDFALMVGSIGLFVIVALLMYFARKTELGW